jgi:hypothetical protein
MTGRATWIVAALLLPAVVTGSGGARWHASVRRATPIAVKLLIWAKQPNSATGARLDVSVDAQATVSISNIDRQQIVDLGSYEPGPHSYSLSSITVFRVDQSGSTQQMTDGGGTCTGQFIVGPFQTYYFLAVTSPNGISFDCRIQ